MNSLAEKQQQICEEIARHFEAKPLDYAHDEWHEYAMGDRRDEPSSTKGFWLFGVIPHLKAANVEWKPLNFFKDETANAILLDELRLKFPYVALVFDVTTIEVELSGCGNLENFSEIFHTTDRKTAVVLAFCHHVGIEFSL